MHEPLTFSSGFKRYLAANVTEDTAGPDAQPGTLEPDEAMQNNSKRGIIILPVGTEAEDETFNLLVYGSRPIVPGAYEAVVKHSRTLQYELPLLLYTIKCTLGTQVGHADAELLDTEILAKDIDNASGGASKSITKSDYADSMESLYNNEAEVAIGTTQGGASVAMLVIPDFFNHWRISLGFVNVGSGGEAASANAFISLET